MGDDKIKRCQKMKQRQQAHFDSMGSKRDMVRRNNVGRMRCGTEKGKERRRAISIRLTQILLDQTIKKIYAIDSASTNG
jgi:hypothetical protein